MRKAYLFLSLLFISGLSFSTEDWSLGKASFTSSNEGIVVIPQCPPGTVLWAIIITSSTPNAVIGIYDSSATYTNLISSISMAGSGSGAFNIPFEIRLSSSLSYKTVGNTSGVTIIYKRWVPF